MKDIDWKYARYISKVVVEEVNHSINRCGYKGRALLRRIRMNGDKFICVQGVFKGLKSSDARWIIKDDLLSVNELVLSETEKEHCYFLGDNFEIFMPL